MKFRSDILKTEDSMIIGLDKIGISQFLLNLIEQWPSDVLYKSTLETLILYFFIKYK